MQGVFVRQRHDEPVTRVAPAPAGAVLARIGNLAYRYAAAPETPRTDVEAPDLWGLEVPAPDYPGAPATVLAAVTMRGAVYAATAKGLAVRSATSGFEPIRTADARRIHSLVRDAAGGLWCGTEKGLLHLKKDGAAESIHHVGGQPLGVVTALGIDHAGALWVGSGSSFRGVWRLTGGRWEKMQGLDGFVHRMSRDNAGVLWFATLDDGPAAGRGAWYFRDNRFFPATKNVSLPSMRVYDVVARDPRGVLWFGTYEGLAAFGGGDQVRLYPDLPGGKVFCVMAARNGALWTGYQRGAGVSRLAGGQWTHFDRKDGLCDDRVWSILEGRPGVMWFATANGVARYDGVAWSCMRGPKSVVWPMLHEGDALLVGTLGDGLFRLDISDRDAPRIIIEDSDAAAGQLYVRWRGEDARFATHPGELRFRVSVNSGDWITVGSHREFQADAKPGRHVVSIQAIDPFGNASTFVDCEITVPGQAWSYTSLIVGGLGFLIVVIILAAARRARLKSRA